MNEQAVCEAHRADFETYIASQLRGRTGADRAEAEAFLRSHPGTSLRDWKGKGPEAPVLSRPDEDAWFVLREAEVREAATREPARLLPQNIRQAAGRDHSLVWNPLARKYRRRLAGEERCGGLGQGGDAGPNAPAPYGTAERRETGARAPTPR